VSDINQQLPACDDLLARNNTAQPSLYVTTVNGISTGLLFIFSPS